MQKIGRGGIDSAISRTSHINGHPPNAIPQLFILFHCPLNRVEYNSHVWLNSTQRLHTAMHRSMNPQEHMSAAIPHTSGEAITMVIGYATGRVCCSCNGIHHPIPSA
jgi:hypothetical protein